MTIYIDNDYKCHVADDGTMTAVETDAFDGKCGTYIEGYRFVPAGQIWMRGDGETFTGEMIAPCKSQNKFDIAQRAYEQNLIVQYKQALTSIEQAVEATS